MFDKIVRTGHRQITTDEYFAARSYMVSGADITARHITYRDQKMAMPLGLYFRQPPSPDSLALDTPISQSETQSTPHFATTVTVTEAGFHVPSGSGVVNFLGNTVTPEGIGETELDAMVNNHGELVTEEGIIYGFFAETQETIAEVTGFLSNPNRLLQS